MFTSSFEKISVSKQFVLKRTNGIFGLKRLVDIVGKKTLKNEEARKASSLAGDLGDLKSSFKLNDKARRRSKNIYLLADAAEDHAAKLAREMKG